jgi:predicted nucleotidyltransferase
MLELILEEMDPQDFTPQTELNSRFWQNEMLKPAVRERLQVLAQSFFDSLDLNWVEIRDILFTGSLANYNWGPYSDVDVHVLVDYTQIADRPELVLDLVLGAKFDWDQRRDVKIFGYEVEMFLQDAQQPLPSYAGAYSLLKDEWLNKPSAESVEIDRVAVQEKASALMTEIDGLEGLFDQGEYVMVLDAVSEMKRRIRKFRQAGLETGGEFSIENLVFKVLRRNGYLERLNDLATRAYDTMMSMEEEDGLSLVTT